MCGVQVCGGDNEGCRQDSGASARPQGGGACYRGGQGVQHLLVQNPEEETLGGVPSADVHLEQGAHRGQVAPPAQEMGRPDQGGSGDCDGQPRVAREDGAHVRRLLHQDHKEDQPAGVRALYQQGQEGGGGELGGGCHQEGEGQFEAVWDQLDKDGRGGEGQDEGSVQEVLLQPEKAVGQVGAGVQENQQARQR